MFKTMIREDRIELNNRFREVFNLLIERGMNEKDERIMNITNQVRLIYTRVGSNLPLISNDGQRNKVSTLLTNYSKAKRTHLKGSAKTTFYVNLDKVYDIIFCKCPIMLCTELDSCDGCDLVAHVVSCSHSRVERIPEIDVNFVRDQRLRSKDRPNSSWQIGNRDRRASREVEEEERRRS